MPPELTPLTPEETTAINTRWSRFCLNPSHDNALTSAHDVPDLLAEVDRLRAEVSEMSDEIHMHRMSHSIAVGNAYDDHTKQQAAEIHRLEAELKAAKSTRSCDHRQCPPDNCQGC